MMSEKQKQNAGYRNCFKTHPDIQKKAAQAAKTPEAKKKHDDSLKYNHLVKGLVLESMKRDLLEASKSGDKSYYEKFIEKFLKAAEDPDSKCGMLLAQSIFTPDLLDKLDAEANKTMEKDLDFLRYRVVKSAIDRQRDVIMSNDGKRVKVACAGRRAGKTEGAARLLVYRAITPNSPELYINKNYQMCMGQIWKPVLQLSESIGLNVVKADSSTGVISFSNGSSIMVKGNNDISSPDVLQGYHFRTIIIDESQSQRNMSYLVDTILRPTMTDYADSIMILQGSPPRIPHTYFERAMSNKSYSQFRWNMFQNPYIQDPDKAIDEICTEKGLTRDSPLIRREYFGESAYDTDAQVYSGYKVYDSIPDDFTPDHVSIGVDFGYVDYSAVVDLVYSARTHQAYITNVDKFNKSTVSDIISVIRRHYADAIASSRKYGFDPSNIMILCDSNEKSIVNELSSNYRLPAYTCYKYDKQYAISSLASDMRTGRILTRKDSPLIDEYEQTVYKRDVSTDAVLPEIDDDTYHPDATDALLYAYRQYCFDIGSRVGGESSDLKGAIANSTLPPGVSLGEQDSTSVIWS